MGSERVIANGSVMTAEVVKALRKIRCGKATVVNSITIRIFNVCMDHSEVPEHWQNACIVPLFKGKGI